MTLTHISTVQGLTKALQQFDRTLKVAIFDNQQGYMSVAFKKEQKIKDNKTLQWLTFYPHEAIPMYSIDTLLGYLSKLPPQAPLAKLTEDNHYTSLFLSIEGMKENGTYYQWLVISDELEYDRFFRKFSTKKEQEMEIKKALDKLLIEVEKETSNSIERVHQWLCKQTTPDLFKGILTEGKTIQGALSYCANKARETAESKSFAVVEDETVYQWISDYYIHYELPKKVEKKKGKAKKKAKKSDIKPIDKVTQDGQVNTETETGGSEQQLELFATV